MHTGKAIGLTGKDGNLISAKKMVLERISAEYNVPEIIDLGHVGTVDLVDTKVLNALEGNGFIPVIAPIGVGPDGESYNINADYVAGAIASQAQASKLILLTNTSGILDNEGNTLSRVSCADVDDMTKAGTIKGGMLPKTACAVQAVNNGVKAVHVIDGRVPHATLLEVFTDGGVGSLIS